MRESPSPPWADEGSAQRPRAPSERPPTATHTRTRTRTHESCRAKRSPAHWTAQTHNASHARSRAPSACMSVLGTSATMPPAPKPCPPRPLQCRQRPSISQSVAAATLWRRAKSSRVESSRVESSRVASSRVESRVESSQDESSQDEPKSFQAKSQVKPSQAKAPRPRRGNCSAPPSVDLDLDLSSPDLS